MSKSEIQIWLFVFFRLMVFSYEIVMAINIEEVIRGQENNVLKIYAA